MSFTGLNKPLSNGELKSIEYICKNYPDVYRRFAQSLTQLMQKVNGKSNAKNIIEGVTGNDTLSKKIFSYSLDKRINKIYKTIQNIFIQTNNRLDSQMSL